MTELGEVLASEIREPKGPRALAESLQEHIAILEGRLAAARTKTDQKKIRRHLKLTREARRWCMSRAGY